MATLVERINLFAVAVRDKFNAIMPRLIPIDGVDGQVLTKNGTTPYAVQWRDSVAGAPTVKHAYDFITNNPTANQMVHWAATAAISGGGNNSSAAASALAKHPGVTVINCATTANSGFRYCTWLSVLNLQGGECARFIFNVPAALAATTRLAMGFTSSGTHAQGSDESILIVDGLSSRGRNSRNNSSSTTAVIATLLPDTWYRAKIEIAPDGLSAHFSIFSDEGTLIGTSSLTANLPTLSDRRLGHGFIATNSGTTSGNIALLDWMEYEEKTLNRNV